ncbi:MAG: AMP-binding protein, partial [Brachybacterium sp.]|nr:AMP-binding protein [Brachybacterium sp.]
MKQFTSPPQHESRPDENTTDLLLGRLRANPSVPIFELAQDDGTYTPLSTADFIEEVKEVAKGLIATGIESGDVVAILSRTRYEWALADWAVWWAGGISVPIYETSSPSQIQWIASDSAAKYVLVESARHREGVESVRGGLPALALVGVRGGGVREARQALGAEVSDEDLEARRTSRQLS